MRCDKTSHKGSEQYAWGDTFPYIPVYGSPLVVSAGTGDRCDNNAGKRCTKCQLLNKLVGNTLQGENHYKHWYNDDTSADSQKSGKNACDCPAEEINQQRSKHDKFSIIKYLS